MKTNRIKWEDMWEKYFENYVGWTFEGTQKKCACKKPETLSMEPDLKLSESKISEPKLSKSEIPEPKLSESEIINSHEPDTSEHDISEPEIPKPEIPEISVPGISEPIAKENKVQFDAINFLSHPHNDSKDKYYPVENYMGSICDECESNEIESAESLINSKNVKKKNCPNNLEPDNSKLVVRSKTIFRQPKDIVFECSTGQGFAFVTPNNDPLIYTPIKTCILKTLGTISIDTSCLKKPMTKVLFSCNLFFVPNNNKGTAQLEFVLYRSCNSSSESHVGNWVYDIIDRGDKLAQNFRLSYCSCNSFPGFYNYFVRVIPVYIKNCSVCITNCHLNAFAQ